MGNSAAPKPGLFRRLLRAIRSLWQEQGDLTERRNTGRAERDSYGTPAPPQPNAGPGSGF